MNDAPVGVPTITGTVTENQTLTANTGGITDADSLGVFNYQWLRNGSAIAGAIVSAYTLGDVDIGTQISVTVSYTDGHGTLETLTSAQTAAVANINDAPIANDDSATTNEDTPVTVDVVANDTDVEGDTLTISAVTQGTNGTVTFAGGSVTYTPNGNFTGSDSFTYTVSDGNGGTSAATVNVSVNAVNDAPVANNDIATTNEDTPVTVNVVSNDSDVDGDSLTVSAVTQGTNGTVTFAGGSVTYTPNGNFNGSDSFTYTVSDGNGGTATATVSVTVNPVNDAPTGAVSINDTTPMQGQLLSASNTLADADGLGAISYRWQRDGRDIVGANGASYTTTQADVGHLLQVIASYTDAHGTAESVASAATAAVANFNDGGTVVIDNLTPAQGDTLTASVSDPDGSTGAVAYQWYRDGVAIAGATTATYTTVQADVGAIISVVANYTDDEGTAESLTSAATAAVTNVNAAPTGSDSTGTNKADVAELPTVSVDTPSLSWPEPPDASPDPSDKVSAPVEVPEKGALIEDILNESNPVSNQASLKRNALSCPSTTTALRSFLQAVSRDSRPDDGARAYLDGVKERLSTREPGRDKSSTADQQQNLRAEQAYNITLARAYEYLRNSLDAVKEEMAGDHQLSKVYLGSAIVSSVGLSVGYVVWLLRGGMLLSSLLSSIPAWQILDPLPILARKKDDDPSDEDESLESILHKKTRNKTKGSKVLGSEDQGSEDQGSEVPGSRLNR